MVVRPWITVYLGAQYLVYPTLFLLYINSLCKLSIPNFSIVTYADDIELLVLVTCVMHADFGELPLGLVMLWLSKNYFILKKPPT